MAFNKENFFQEGNSEDSFLSRTNPLANAANAEILKIEECGSCDIELDIAITTSGGTTTVVLNAPTSGYDVVMIHITDGKGNYATGSGAGAIDTAHLDSSATWIVTVYIENGTDKILSCVCSKKYSFEYVSADGIEINTETLGIGLLRASASPTGTYATSLVGGSFPAGGTTESIEFWVKNTGVNALQVTGIAASGDATAVAWDNGGYLGEATLYAGDIRKVQVTVNSSGLAGLYSGIVTFTFIDGTTQAINVNYTLA